MKFILFAEHRMKSIYSITTVLFTVSEVIRIQEWKIILPQHHIYCPHDIGIIAIKISAGATEFFRIFQGFEIKVPERNPVTGQLFLNEFFYQLRNELFQYFFL